MFISFQIETVITRGRKRATLWNAGDAEAWILLKWCWKIAPFMVRLWAVVAPDLGTHAVIDKASSIIKFKVHVEIMMDSSRAQLFFHLLIRANIIAQPFLFVTQQNSVTLAQSHTHR